MGFLKSYLIMAVFRADGTFPDWREWFIIVVIRGLIGVCFHKSCRKGVEGTGGGHILLIIISASCCDISGKQCRGWEIASCK